MIRVERAIEDDVSAMVEMEQASDTRDFILPYAAPKHLENLREKNIVYLRICDDETFVGFFILALDSDGESVEFRRVVVREKGRGTGQRAIAAMEAYCRDALKRSRIWLDVFEHNARGRHVYAKLGYLRFGQRDHERGRLLLFEKRL